MSLFSKAKNVTRKILLKCGGSKVKEWIWNEEFSAGRWNCLNDTSDDCVYQFIEKYCRNGSILDLGCGSGNTGKEINMDRYSSYTGVDVSGVAIQQAEKETRSKGRGKKNQYFKEDICKYEPEQNFDVILFRDSIYYMNLWQIKPLIERYSAYLKDEGVFIVRMFDREDGSKYIELIRNSYDIIEEFTPESSKAAILIFRTA